MSSACGLEIRDTADWKSALHLAALQTPEVRLLASVALISCFCLAASAAELRIGQVTVAPGAVVSVPVTCNGASEAVGVQFDVSFDPSFVSLTSISAGNSLLGHVVDHQQLAPGQWRALVYSTTNGPIVPGTVLWLNFAISAAAPDNVVPLAMTNAILAQAAGQRVQPLAQVSGTLIIAFPNVLSLSNIGGGRVVVTITGDAESTVTLQGTPDLFHWADLGAYTNQTGTLMVTDSIPVGRMTYFYRTVFRPPTTPYPYPAPNLSGLGMLTNGRTTFQLNSTAGSAWRILGSPDFLHWGNYGVVTNPSGTLPITNTPVGKPRDYFYRAAQP